MIFFLSCFVLAFAHAQRWGTFKPHLYFALKDIHDPLLPQTVGFFWVVKDWRTDLPLARYRYQNAKFENTKAWFEYHDGSTFAREVILDNDYNTRFEIDWLQVDTEWQLKIIQSPIDTDRESRATPFIFLKKSES
jgi:hypothetical protein